uniref:Synaptobrevin, longin-like domain protein n=1 Tax=Tanacetum cinerariifolium TaxID=118510 RepID=A0A699JXW3_TANCI|nr:hypothetical protein [Tanacetum cinerariifolium]
MVAYLNKSDASEDFDQVINFLNDSYIKSQSLVDKKKVVITEATTRDALRLDDAAGVDCLPNEEIFAKLARMGYEKPSTKLTFYKAFFSSQWKFLIHTILQSMSAKRTSWNELSNGICCHLLIYRVGKGFSGVETSLFEGMLVGVIEEQGAAEEQVQDDVDDAAAQGDDTVVSGNDVHEPSIPSPTPSTPPPQQSQDLPSTSQEALDAYAALTRRVEHLEYDKRIDSLDDTEMEDASNQGRMIDKLDMDEGVALMDDKEKEKKADEAQVIDDDQVKERQAEIYQIDMDHASKVLIRVAAASTRRRKRVVIRDPEEESTAIIPADTKSKDKGKGIMVEEPKPLKKKQ